MKTFGKDRLLRGALRCLLAGLFLAAAAGKIQDPLAFADSIAAYEMIPWKPGITLLALTLPVFEILLAVLLITGMWLRAALLGSGWLTAVFTVALVSAMARGLEIDCGCFGESAILNLAPGWAVARNAVILLLCAWLYAAALSGRTGEK